MSLQTGKILRAMISHGMATGHFDRFAGHEPKRAPGNGVWGAAFLGPGGADGEISGLNSVSVAMVVNVRVTQNMLKEPQDDIDPFIADAVDALMNAYAGNFTLGGLVRNVDVFGQSGPALGWDAGYLEQDGKHYRAIMITVPLLVNDVWSLSP